MGSTGRRRGGGAGSRGGGAGRARGRAAGARIRAALRGACVAAAVSALLAAAGDARGADGAAPEAPGPNGFSLRDARVDPAEIVRGGPPRDGIPALDHPPTLPAAAAPWHEDEIVIGVVVGEEARAYPIAILTWHELVNDTLGGRPILVSYCPLCGTGMVFERSVAGHELRFGVSGLLYRSDLLLYDRETESLWSQIASEAVAGPLAGSRLRLLRSTMTRWGDWRAAHPSTTVLSLETGHARHYGSSPYGDYALSPRVYFPVPLDRRYHPKMPTVGVRLPGGPARAYPAVEIVRAGGLVEERFEGRRVRIAYDPDRQVFDIEAPEDLEVIEGFWFAWSAFHPETTVFTAVDPAGAPPPDGAAR